MKFDYKTLDKLIEENGLEECKEYLYESARSSIQLSLLGEETYEKIGNSRIVGYPDLPRDMEWPRTEDGERMTFIAQLNLKDIKPLDKEDLLPETGILYFFMGLDEPAYNIEHKVIYVENTVELAKRELDEASILEETYGKFVSYRLSARETIQLPTYAYMNNEKISEDDDLYDGYGNMELELFDKDESYIGHLYGYPEEQHDDCELEAALMIVAGEEYSYKEEEIDKLVQHFNGDKEKAQQEINEMVMLLEVDSSDPVGFCWWDCGVIHFFIRREDLLNRKFDNTYLSLYSS